MATPLIEHHGGAPADAHPDSRQFSGTDVTWSGSGEVAGPTVAFQRSNAEPIVLDRFDLLVMLSVIETAVLIWMVWNQQ